MKGIILLAFSVAASMSLSGCFVDFGDEGDEQGGGVSGNAQPPPTGEAIPPGGQQQEERFQPISITGNVTGTLDCQSLASGGQPVESPALVDIPANAEGRSYSLTWAVSESQGEALCMYESGAKYDTVGQVPAGATQFAIYADGAPIGTSFTVDFY